MKPRDPRHRDPARPLHPLRHPAERGVLHHVEQPQPEQHRAQRGKAHAVVVGEELRRIHVDRQPRRRQDRAEEGVGRKPVARACRGHRGHLVTSSAGGCGRVRNCAPFHQSFSACQWISPSTRRDPIGRRSAEPIIAPVVSGRRLPVSVAISPPLPVRVVDPDPDLVGPDVEAERISALDRLEGRDMEDLRRRQRVRLLDRLQIVPVAQIRMPVAIGVRHLGDHDAQPPLRVMRTARTTPG